MENLNIKINVEVGLSKDTKEFLSNVFSLAAAKASNFGAMTNSYCCNDTGGKFVEDTFVENKPAEKQAEKQAEKPAEKQAEKPAEKPTEIVDKPKTKSSITVEELRNLLSMKVNAHRKEIKEKLEQLGAPSITKLAEENYEEMYSFLESL